MTLVVCAMNKDYAIQISDRRLSAAGMPTTDESNKAFSFHCDDARLLVGFSGLARCGSFEMGPWLTEALRDAGPPDFKVNSIMQRFCDRANNGFSKHPALVGVAASQRRTTFMLSGFIYDETWSAYTSVFALISNFQDFRTLTDSLEAWPEFRPYFGTMDSAVPNPINVQRIGAYAGFADSDVRALQDLLRAGVPPEGVVAKGFEIVRAIADRPESANTIGKQLTAVILPANPTEPSRDIYSTARPSHATYMSDIVSAKSATGSFIMRDLKLMAVGPEGTPPLVMPKQRRNQLCACGSGKKYKHCHGRGA